MIANPRIGIIGAHCVGKTTLAKLLAERYNLPFIEEHARKAAMDLGIQDMEHVPVDKALILQKNVLAAQMSDERKHWDTGFVSDRTALDNLSYWIPHKLRNTPDYYAAALDVDTYLRRRPYDLVVFLHPEGTVEADGFRSTCEHCQHLMDALIETMLEPYRKVLTVIEPTGPAEARLEAVSEKLRKIFRLAA